MAELIKQLNIHFCEELNTSKFSEIKKLVLEAKEQGYDFKLDYSPNLFIEERIMGKDLEKEFCSLPE